MRLRLAAAVEAVGGALLLVAGFLVLYRSVELGPGEAVGLSLVAAAGALLAADAFTSRAVPAGFLAWLGRARARYRAAPFRLGPIRAWNPELLAVAGLFALDAAAAILAGGVAGRVLGAVAGALAAYNAYKALVQPTTSKTPRVPWWVRLSRLVPSRLAPALDMLSPIIAPRLAGALGVTSREALAAARAYAFAGVLAGLAIGIPGALLLGAWGLLLGVAGLLGPLLGTLAYAAARERLVDKRVRQELPFIAVLGSLAAQAGLGLEWAVARLSGPDYPGAREFWGSRAAHDVVLGYRAILASGGDVSRYLEGWAGRAVERFGLWLRRFLQAMSGAATAIAAVAGLGMALGVVVALLPQGSPGLIPAFALVVVPGSVAAGIMMVEALAPEQRDRYDWRREALAATTGAIAALALGVPAGAEPWLLAGLALAGAAAGAGIVWRLEHRIVILEERGLEEALERIVEARRLGKPLVDAVGEAAKTVNPVAGERLRRAWLLARARGSLEGAHAYWRSWLGRATMRVLAAAEEAGATQPAHILLLARTVASYRRAREEARAELGMTRVVAAVAPPIIGFLIVFLEALSRALSLGPETLLLQPVPEAYFAQAKASVLLLALGLGVLAGKLSSFTIRDLLPAAVGLLASIGALLLGASAASTLLQP